MPTMPLARPATKPSARLVQLVHDPSSWAYGLRPAQAEQVASWLQANGFLGATSA
ncbi:MAG: hypothetical protein LC620_02035 [Halobacteriales archaeon]|nr:hypothetical protein [Halobacteriales archaeon]